MIAAMKSGFASSPAASPSARPREVQEFRAIFSRRALFLLIALLLAETTINFIDRQVVSVLAPTLRGEFSLSNSQYAAIINAFLVTYAICYSLAGDYFPPRAVASVYGIAGTGSTIRFGDQHLGRGRGTRLDAQLRAGIRGNRRTDAGGNGGGYDDDAASRDGGRF